MNGGYDEGDEKSPSARSARKLSSISEARSEFSKSALCKDSGWSFSQEPIGGSSMCVDDALAGSPQGDVWIFWGGGEWEGLGRWVVANGLGVR